MGVGIAKNSFGLCYTFVLVIVGSLLFHQTHITFIMSIFY